MRDGHIKVKEREFAKAGSSQWHGVHMHTQLQHRVYRQVCTIGHFLIVVLLQLPIGASGSVHFKPNWACQLLCPSWCARPCQAPKDAVAVNLLLSFIIEFTNSTCRNLTKQGICQSFKQSRQTTLPMTISLFTTPRYTLTTVDMLICMPIPRMLFQPYWAWVLLRIERFIYTYNTWQLHFLKHLFYKPYPQNTFKLMKEFQNPFRV